MTQLQQLTDLLIKFRDARDWKQFHNPKDLALAISIESSELLEAFLWKPAESVPVEKVKEEIADVFAYLVMLADHYNLDLEQVVREKVQQNEVKYPVDKAKGKSNKYNEL
jgi:NTP pyrophosphatase (non-canonical NTP hydrolase)